MGPQQQRFGLSQMFPWFGKLGLRGDVAVEAAKAQQQQYEAAKLRLYYQVKDAYYELYYLARAIEITEENKELMTFLESAFNIKVTMDDLDIENFKTVEATSRFVQRKEEVNHV